MHDPLEKPRVLSVLATRGHGKIQAVQSQLLFHTDGSTHAMPGLVAGSALCFNFNVAWTSALNLAKDGVIDYFLLRHDDIEVRTMRWLDRMIAEMGQHKAAVLSAVVPLKGPGQETSTAVCTGDPWDARRLTIDECYRLPPTFCLDDVKAEFGFPFEPRALLANTGLMLVDMSRPEFFELNGDSLDLMFTQYDRVTRDTDGKLKPQFISEDWNFSRLCHERGLPVYCTTMLEILHWGDHGYSNRRPAQ